MNSMLTRSAIEERLEHIENHLQKNCSFETLETIDVRKSNILLENIEWLSKSPLKRFFINIIDLIFLDITFVEYNFLPFVTFSGLVGSLYANQDMFNFYVGLIQLLFFYIFLNLLRKSL